MPADSDSIFHSGEAGGQGPVFSDISFQNERAMWWAEFDSVGEDVVRGYVERNAYAPTGMEVARQWLAQRELLQLREDVRSIKALAEQAQETASESLNNASKAFMLAREVDADSHAVVEIAATAKKYARIVIFVGTIASLFALAAIVMVLASSRQVAPITKQASEPTSRPKQPVARSLPAAVPPAQTGQAISPENAQTEQPSNTLPINSPDLKAKGQSMAEALALIADKVGGEGTINFAAQILDAATGREHTEQVSYKASNVTIDPNRCQVGYRWHVEQNGAVSDQDRTVELRLVKNIRVTSIDAEPGHRFVMRADPKVYVVHIARWDNASGDHLYFRDQDMAARVAAAARRAVELCDNEGQQYRRR